MKKLLRFIGRYKGLFILSLILNIITVLIQLYIPILFGKGIDLIAGKGNVDFGGLHQKIILILILLSASGIFTWVLGIVNNRMTYGIVKQIRAAAIRKLQKLPLSFLDRMGVGDLVSRIITDTDQVSDGLLLGFTQLFAGVVTILATIYFMLRLSPWITLLVVCLTPISFFVSKFIASGTYKMFKLQSEIRGQQTALTEEMVGGARVVHAFGYENRAEERFSEINERLKNASTRAVFYSSLTNPSTRAVNGVIYACVALTGAFMILKGHLSIGGLSILLAYANQYMKPFTDISSVVTELQNALSCADRVFEVLEEPAESEEKPQHLTGVRGAMDIEDVYFSYVKEKPLIENFSLRVNEGTRVAVVGPTGCGKTTFINLLMRFYDVDKGRIFIDGTDIYEVSRRSLRESFGMVLQETWIKNATVRENIAFGRPDATDEEIIKAAKEAHAYSFIRRLPEGLDTVIDDSSLSQGQKQLLCISRVMLTKPPMLILDEATSSIDTRTELKIQNAFEKIMDGRTTFIVAHRLSTIRSADIILVMKDGHIIEQGKHEELLKKGGFYSELYYSQFAGVEI
ncbi:MAG: ABC transporter ATP-binding protein/permease [Lachnospiraceae bacterium]|nr:ABC transporter ATP-binding protein/permease [Lachnospiraceae bacterium]